MATKKISALREQMSEKALKDANSHYEILKTAYALGELRESLELGQKDIQVKLDISQPAVSKMEKQIDMHISTLRDYIEAVGGKLEIHAVFPEFDVLINQFKKMG